LSSTTDTPWRWLRTVAGTCRSALYLKNSVTCWWYCLFIFYLYLSSYFNKYRTCEKVTKKPRPGLSFMSYTNLSCFTKNYNWVQMDSFVPKIEFNQIFRIDSKYRYPISFNSIKQTDIKHTDRQKNLPSSPRWLGEQSAVRQNMTQK
jgi:hypothetical protein